jgi:hypothetical protein
MNFDYNVEKQEITVELNTPSITLDTPTGGRGLQGIQGPRGKTGDTGPRGEDGYTPVKGVDYFTEEDIESLNIPTKVSDLSNDLNFIDNTIDNLTNYYTSTNTYTKTEIDTLVGNKQDTLVSGTNIKTINNTSLLGSGNINIQGGSGGSSTDVKINGTSITSNDEADIQTEGTYNATTNKIATMSDLPTVPTKVSDLQNDAGYITGYTETDPTVPSYVKSITQSNITSWNNKSDFSGSYTDLTNKPTIPSKTSDLTNDSGFIDNTYHDSTKQNTLVSGTNIKTINNQTLLGSGNITIEGTIKELTSPVILNQLSDGYYRLPSGCVVYSMTGESLYTIEKSALLSITNNVASGNDITTYLIIEDDTSFEVNSDETIIDITSNPNVNIKYGLICEDTGDVVHYDKSLSDFITSEADPVFTASAAAGITSSDISNWNNKSDYKIYYTYHGQQSALPFIFDDMDVGIYKIYGLEYRNTLYFKGTSSHNSNNSFDTGFRTLYYFKKYSEAENNDVFAFMEGVNASGEGKRIDFKKASGSSSGVTISHNTYTTLALASSVPTKVSDLTNDAGYITSSALSGYATTTALNTVQDQVDTNTADIGDLSHLETTDVTNLVAAINEIYEDNYFKPGDTYVISNYASAPGYITSSNKNLNFPLTLPKSLKNINTITITTMSIDARVPAGAYAVNNFNVNSSGVTIGIEKRDDRTIDISLKRTTNWYGTNNIPISVAIYQGATITFS